MMLHVPPALLVAGAWLLEAVLAEGAVGGALLGIAVGEALEGNAVGDSLVGEAVAVATVGSLLDTGAGVPLPELQPAIESTATMATATPEGP
ncbi:hypothetical protein [Streptomyces kaniharaensis]|uniref:hypothetical protein n=1 Tax=Streptomyces kaniharaensis TaxID=212423 RepID=UPI0012966ECE|nr:hypothetical protein [Streptomyces kaniharaensis]